MYKWIILMSGLFASLTACAKVKLSPLFSDNMVLQQEAEVPVWGKASPEMRVIVIPSWSGEKYENIAANTWFLIESLRVPSQEEIDSFRVKYMAENQVYVRRLEDVLDASTRPNRVYCSQFHECSEEIEDEFCLV